MSKDTKVKLTCEEGQALLRVASNFSLPEKLGEASYNVAERGIADIEARALYRMLKAYSPMLQRPERWLLFGPQDNYREIKGDNGAAGWRMMDTSKVVEVRLDEEAESGAMWCLILAVHPASPMCQPVGMQEDIFWPVAEKLKKVNALKKEIGLDKAKPRRWESDDDMNPAAEAGGFRTARTVKEEKSSPEGAG